MVAKKNINSAFYCFCRVTVSNATKSSTFFFSRRLYVTTTLHVWRLKESAKECDVKSEEASRQVLARNEFETAGVLEQEKEEEGERGDTATHSHVHHPSISNGEKCPRKKSYFKQKSHYLNNNGNSPSLLESLSPINNPVWHSCYCLWKATALGFILLYKKTEISPMQYAMHGYPCNLGYPVGPRLVVYS